MVLRLPRTMRSSAEGVTVYIGAPAQFLADLQHSRDLQHFG